MHHTQSANRGWEALEASNAATCCKEVKSLSVDGKKKKIADALATWRRQRQPTPVFLPRESCGWRSLVGCRLWGRTESDMTEATCSSGSQGNREFLDLGKELYDPSSSAHYWSRLSFSPGGFANLPQLSCFTNFASYTTTRLSVFLSFHWLKMGYLMYIMYLMYILTL